MRHIDTKNCFWKKSVFYLQILKLDFESLLLYMQNQMRKIKFSEFYSETIYFNFFRRGQEIILGLTTGRILCLTPPPSWAVTWSRSRPRSRKRSPPTLAGPTSWTTSTRTALTWFLFFFRFWRLFNFFFPKTKISSKKPPFLTVEFHYQEHIFR